MSNPYERLTVAEAVRHVDVAENTINAILEELYKTTGMRIEIEVTQAFVGPPVVVLLARAK